MSGFNIGPVHVGGTVGSFVSNPGQTISSMATNAWHNPGQAAGGLIGMEFGGLAGNHAGQVLGTPGALSMGSAPVTGGAVPMGAISATNPSGIPGAPPYPTYAPAYDPNTMSDVANLKQLGPQYDSGFNELRSQALNKGPSSWLNMSQLHNQMQLDDALNKGQQTSAASTAGQESALAAGGGLSSGARERVQEQGGNNLMSMNQNLQRTNQEQNLGLQTTDQGNKIGQLNSLVGAENTKQNQWNDAFKTDVSAGEQNVAQNNAFNMNLYGDQLTALAAQQQAAATAASGPSNSGGLLGFLGL